MKFKTESEAISRANDSIYGLGAALFTKDVSRLHRVARSPQSGTIWANNSNSNMDPRVAFGGMKQSGIGRELGTVGYESYTNIRAVYLHLDENEGEIVNDEEPVPRKAHL